MPFERLPLLSCGSIPQANGVVATSASDCAAIRTECNAKDPSWICACPFIFTSRGIIQANFLMSSSSDCSAIWAKCNTRDPS